MPNFIIKNNPGLKNDITFSPEDTHHLLNVLRYKIGNSLQATDNSGAQADIKITSVKPLRFQILKTYTKKKPFALQVALPLIDKKRLEWTIEKLCELDIESVQLIVTERTQKNSLSSSAFAKLYKISETAQKQSGRCYPLHIHKPKKLFEIDFSSFSEKFSASLSANPFAIPQSNSSEKKLLVIGPEGGLTSFENQKIDELGFNKFSLGQTVLRTESAALVASTLLKLS